MNIALIFAGGAGIRMNSKDKPKQFLLIHGKPIIVHTIEAFEQHEEIDAIIVVCIEEWIPYMEEMKYRYRLNKIAKIVHGGKTGQLSIYNGLEAAQELYHGQDDHIVLIHDGVRPLISAQTISDNIKTVKSKGSAITCVYSKETIVVVNEQENVCEIPERIHSRCAKAPQSFYLKDIWNVHKRAKADGYTDMIDSCSLMRHYGNNLTVVYGNEDNIKITTPEDFYIFRALYDAKENQQIE